MGQLQPCELLKRYCKVVKELYFWLKSFQIEIVAIPHQNLRNFAGKIRLFQYNFFFQPRQSNIA